MIALKIKENSKIPVHKKTIATGNSKEGIIKKVVFSIKS